MNTFKFVGTECQFGDVTLRRLGQEIASNATHGAALVTLEQWEQCGFTDDDVKRYATPGARHEAPVEFQEKMRKACAFVAANAAQEAK